MKGFSLTNIIYLYIIVCFQFLASCTAQERDFDEDFLRRIKTGFVKDVLASLPEHLKGNPETLAIVRKESIRLSSCDLSFLDAQPSDIKNMYIWVALSIEDNNGLTIYSTMIADAFLQKLASDERYQNES